MGLKDDLTNEVRQVFGDQWKHRDAAVVPEPDTLKLSNDAAKLHGAVFYADLAGSMSAVTTQPWTFAAEVFKTFLHCAAKVVRVEGGNITAYDGDRIMAVFMGVGMEAAAARAALKLRFAVINIVQPALHAQYPKSGYNVRYCAGLDSSSLVAARTGIRGNNDLVWVGRAANYAAKLSEVREWPYSTYATASFVSSLPENLRRSEGMEMWESRTWNALPGAALQRTSYHIVF